MEGWRGSGRDEAARETSDERCLVAGARSSSEPGSAEETRALRLRTQIHTVGRWEIWDTSVETSMT